MSVAAPARVVWDALAARVPGAQGARAEAYGRLVAAEPRQASGRLFDDGATLPGFTVVEAEPHRFVRLAGRHRFSRYELRFALAEHSGATELTARTLADFPGLPGSLYRLVVIRSGAHRVLVNRMMRAVRRDAERALT